VTVKITGLQQVRDALKKELDKFSSEYALIGIHEDAGNVEGENFTMATLGATQHFGNDRVPARPFLDLGVAKGNQEYLHTIQKGIKDGLTSKQIVERVGLLAVGNVKEYITDLRSPPNAPSTIKRKGSSNPLIDTGAMRASIKHIVSSKKPEESL
jgi:hypothetical protein|tara:strand:- start:17033 stop:17497 length:465 start_codon:yes stop_codon:yes gene_type:complete